MDTQPVKAKHLAYADYLPDEDLMVVRMTDCPPTHVVVTWEDSNNKLCTRNYLRETMLQVDTTERSKDDKGNWRRSY